MFTGEESRRNVGADSRGPGRSARALALGLGIVALAIWMGMGPRRLARAAGSPEDGEFWEHDVPSALRIASESSRWVLVYFSATTSSDLSRPPDGDLIARRLKDRALGAHATAADAVSLMQAYEITRLPALVLLDGEGLVVYRWPGRWTGKDVVTTFRAQEKRVTQLEREVEKLLTDAEAALARPDERAAIRLCTEAYPRTREGSSARRRLLRIVDRVRERGEQALVEILAGEGIERDYRLVKSLEDLKKRYPVRALESEIDREIERLEERKIGGRR